MTVFTKALIRSVTKQSFIFSLSFLGLQVYGATWSSKQEIVWDTQQAEWITPDQLAEKIHAQEIWVMGEQHATPENAADPENIVHHQNQLRLLEGLNQTAQKNGFSVSLGMEFLTYTYQPFVDQYLQGSLSEKDFLKAVQWGGSPFESYREQIRVPTKYAARTWALNIPQSIAGHVAKVGPDGLTDEETRLLPPRWELGNPQYFERFKEVMGDHVPEEKIANYFWAQSLWDSTMAWKATEAIATNSQSLMIIVGEFHVIYGGGLPEMISRYSLGRIQTAHSALSQVQVHTVLQTSVDNWSAEALQEAVQPDASYGPQADYIWVHLNQFLCEGGDCPNAVDVMGHKQTAF
jgi:uncharacterized iron-regulated protein